MQLGLFLRRELITLARRGKVFHERVLAVLLASGVVSGCVLFWDRLDWDRTTVAGASRFGLSTFGLAVVIQVLTAPAIISRHVASSIASERDRKSLDALLATRLTSAEIVFGIMVAGLVEYGNWLAASLPLIVLVAIVAGVQLPLLLLTVVGLGSSLFAGAALGGVVSIYAPNRSRAVSKVVGLIIAWIDLPLIAEFLQPLAWPGSPRWFVHAVRWLVDSSPAGVGVSLFLPTLVPRSFGLVEAILRMIALQLTGGLMLVFWATSRLRPASRALYDGEWTGLSRWLMLGTRRRTRSRRPCGDDPVLWNDIHSQGSSSLVGRLSAELAGLVGVGVLVLGTSWFAIPAFSELAERGYGAAREGFTMPEVNPLARVLIGKLLIPAGGVAPGQARLEFNIALRQFSAMLVMLYVVMVCGTAAMSVISEKERDTWHGLIATSLTGWEIVRAKMVGALWRARSVALTLIALWATGLLAGAVHPLGFVSAVAGLGAVGAFYAALGVAFALQVDERKRANHLILLLVLCVLPASGLAILLPGGASVFLGVCSTPFLIWTSLFSYEDVRSMVISEVLPQLGGTSIKPGVGARTILAACWVATIAHAAGAVFLTREVCRSFDRLVGRPVRSGGDRRAGILSRRPEPAGRSRFSDATHTCP
jgi:ABC-type Na+ efflux pump permease subunit